MGRAVAQALALALALVAVVLGPACAELPELGTCGNGVVEASGGEACDRGGADPLCSATCELLCVDAGAAPDGYVDVGAGAFCPAGHACGVDGRCRAPSGAFAQVSDPVSVLAEQFVVGDVDADGAVDVISAGGGAITVHLGSADPAAALARSSVHPAPPITGPIFAADYLDDASVDGGYDGATDLRVPTSGGVLKLVARAGGFQQDVGLTLLPGVTLASQIMTLEDGQGRAGLYLAALQPVVNGTVDVALQAFVGQAATTVALCDTGLAAGSLLGAPSVRAGPAGDTVAVTVSGPSLDRVCVFEPAGPGWAALPSARVFGRDAGGAPTRARAAAQLVVAPQRRLGCRFDLLVPTGLRSFDFFGDDDDLAPCEYDRGPTPLGIPETTDALAAANLGDPDAGGEDADELVFDSGVYAHFTGALPGPTWQRLYPASRLANPWAQAVVGDVDGNGRLDLVLRAIDRRAGGDVLLDDVVVLRNLGATPLGVRLAATRFSTVGPVRTLLAADFTGDGAADVLMAEERQLGSEGGAGADALTWLRGRPGAGPAAVEVIDDRFAGTLALLRLGDTFDGTALGSDGLDDAILLETSPGGLAAGRAFGSSGGGLVAPQWGSPVDVEVLAAATVPGAAGLLDLHLVARDDQPPAKRWWWPALAEGVYDATGVGTPTVLADLAGEVEVPRPIELVVARTSDGGHAVVGLGARGDLAADVLGTACAAWTLQHPGGRRDGALAAADLDGQPGDEVMLGDRVWPAIGAGCASPAAPLFQVAPIVNAVTCPGLAAIDTDGDGLPELAALCTDDSGQAFVQLLERTGAASYAALAGSPRVEVAGNPERLLVGDLTADGLVDLVVVARVAQVPTLTVLAQCDRARGCR